jgi:hypothetical protein
MPLTAPYCVIALPALLPAKTTASSQEAPETTVRIQDGFPAEVYTLHMQCPSSIVGRNQPHKFKVSN